MNPYEKHVLPRIINVVCNMKVAREQRERVCEGLAGEVVEIGFGSGLNVPVLPRRGDAGRRGRAGRHGLEARAEALGRRTASRSSAPASTASRSRSPTIRFDAALSTWTMCTIPDIDAALRELRRVLKPGGTLHFVEHGLAPDESVRVWQNRLEPGPESPVRRLQPQPADDRPAARRRLRDRPGRLVLREGLAQVRRGEHARRGALRLSRRSARADRRVGRRARLGARGRAQTAAARSRAASGRPATRGPVPACQGRCRAGLRAGLSGWACAGLPSAEAACRCASRSAGRGRSSRRRGMRARI